MTERNQRPHSSTSYRDAAERTTAFINDPVRLGMAIGAATAVIAVLPLLQARIIGAVAERIPSTVTASIADIALAAIVGTCAILPRRFGFLPLAARLPDDFERRCPYPADSPEARILAVLFVARLRDGYVFFTDHLSYFAMLDDDAVHAALRTLEADGRATIAKNTSPLTEKGRAREFAQLTDTALAG